LTSTNALAPGNLGPAAILAMFNKPILPDNAVMTTVQRESRLRRFVRLDGADKWLLLRATGWLVVARIMLIFMPFRHLSARLSAESNSTHIEPEQVLLQRIAYAVSAAANNVPWRSDCFPQTIAARMLLKRHGYASTIHFGVERVGEDVLNGHAWLTCGETVVIGGAELHRYSELHSLSE
jgi:hypothetical protein